MSAQDFMPDEAAIAAIRANIEAYEAERRSAHRRVRLRLALFLVLILVAVLALGYGFNVWADPYEQWSSTPHVFLYCVGIVAVGCAWFLASRPADRLRQSFRERLLPIIFGFISDMRYAYRITPDSFEKLPREVLGSFNRQRFDDVVSGHYDGFSFELYEASLSHKSGESDDSVFRGVIVAFDIVTPFPGLLVATRKRGQVSRFFGGIFGGGLEQLECGVTALDAVYDFRTDNLDAARPLVTGHLAQALKWLGETWPEEQALVALKGGDGFLLLPRTDDFFELPPTSTQLDYRTHIEPIVADMAAILATAALVRRIGAEEQQ